MWQRQKDGSLRLRADYKVHVDDKIMTQDYPLHDMETSFHEIEGSEFHLNLDLSSVCYQRMLDEAAQDICVISTTLSLFRLLRLPQGMEKASAMFQQTIENTLKRLVGTICFQDDVLVP